VSQPLTRRRTLEILAAGAATPLLAQLACRSTDPAEGTADVPEIANAPPRTCSLAPDARFRFRGVPAILLEGAPGDPGWSRWWEQPRWGYIDGRNEVVIAPQFYEAEPFGEGLAVTQDDQGVLSVIDAIGTVKFTLEGTVWPGERFVEQRLRVLVDFEDQPGTAFVDPEGTLIRIREGDNLAQAPDAAPFSEGKAAVGVTHPHRRDSGWIGLDGRMVIGARFSAARSFSEGIAGAKDPNTGRWGFVDEQGHWAIEPRFEYGVGDLSEGLARVEDGYIDREGKHRFRLKHGSTGSRDFQLSNFADGRARVSTPDDLVGFLDAEGRMAIPARFFDAHPFSDGLAAACVEPNRWGYIDPDGAWAIPPALVTAGDFQDGIAEVALDEDTSRYLQGLENPDPDAYEPAVVCSALLDCSGKIIRKAYTAGWGSQHADNSHE